jgi:hypothetical protein
MFIQPIAGWVKKLAEDFQKPTTYGSELEEYITSKNPQNTADVEMLMRQYNQHQKGWLL